MSNPILTFTNWVWGYPMLIWLVGGGIFLSFRYKFIQFTKLGFVLKNTIVKAFKGGEINSDGNKISGYKAVTGALASTLGGRKYRGNGNRHRLRRPGRRVLAVADGPFCLCN